MITIHSQEVKFTKFVHLLQSKTILQVRDAIISLQNKPKVVGNDKTKL